MGKPVNSNTTRAETFPLSTTINKEVMEAFRDCCGELGYPMNVMIETFMQQYINGRYKISGEDILKFKNDCSETDALNTTLNKEIYLNFKSICKYNGYFVKHVIAAFMEEFISKNFILEYVHIDEIKEHRR